jgi:hypothetical protein
MKIAFWRLRAQDVTTKGPSDPAGWIAGPSGSESVDLMIEIGADAANGAGVGFGGCGLRSAKSMPQAQRLIRQ